MYPNASSILDLILSLTQGVLDMPAMRMSSVGVQGSAETSGSVYGGKAYPSIVWYYVNDSDRNTDNFTYYDGISTPQQDALYKAYKISPVKLLPKLADIKENTELRGSFKAVCLSDTIRFLYKDGVWEIQVVFKTGAPDIMSKIFLVMEGTLKSPLFQGKKGIDSIYPNDSIQDTVIPPDEKDWRLVVRQGLPVPPDDKDRPKRPYAQFVDDKKPYPWRYNLELVIKETALKEIKPETTMAPGELVALACEPFSNRGFAWYYQETYPFVYSALWFETVFFTSGIVENVIDITTGEPLAEGKDSVIDSVYEIRCKERLWTGSAERFKKDYPGDYKELLKLLGVEESSLPSKPQDDNKDKLEVYLYVESTDYKLYRKGDRVALLKSGTTKSNIETLVVSHVKIPDIKNILYQGGIKHYDKPPFRLVPYDFYKKLAN